MKNLKGIILSLLLLSHFAGIYGQSYTLCEDTTGYSKPGDFTFCGALKRDAEVDLYIPNANMPTLQFKVNYVFLRHPTLPTVFANNSYDSLVADAKRGLEFMNWRFQYCGLPASNLTPLVPTTTVYPTKIELVLNGVYIYTNSIAISHITHENTDTLFELFPVDTAHNAINFYYYQDPRALWFWKSHWWKICRYGPQSSRPSACGRTNLRNFRQ